MRWTGGRAAAWAASLMGRGLRARSGPCRWCGGTGDWAPPGGRDGWRCDRRRRRGGGRGAARRRGDAPSRPGAAPCAPGFSHLAPWLAPSLHSCDASTTPPRAWQLIQG
eukprot:scaffold25091_cov56-Phaeocystis_antarctica.AAC.3